MSDKFKATIATIITIVLIVCFVLFCMHNPNSLLSIFWTFITMFSLSCGMWVIYCVFYDAFKNK